MNFFESLKKSLALILTCCVVTAAHADTIVNPNGIISAQDNAGNIVLLMSAYDSTKGNTVVQAATGTYSAGAERWSTFETISDPSKNVADIHLTIDPLSGNAVAVWTSSVSNTSWVQGAFYTFNKGWSTVFTISTSGQLVFQGTNLLTVSLCNDLVTIIWGSMNLTPQTYTYQASSAAFGVDSWTYDVLFTQSYASADFFNRINKFRHNEMNRMNQRSFTPSWIHQ